MGNCHEAMSPFAKIGWSFLRKSLVPPQKRKVEHVYLDLLVRCLEKFPKHYQEMVVSMVIYHGTVC